MDQAQGVRMRIVIAGMGAAGGVIAAGRHEKRCMVVGGLPAGWNGGSAGTGVAGTGGVRFDTSSLGARPGNRGPLSRRRRPRHVRRRRRARDGANLG